MSNVFVIRCGTGERDVVRDLDAALDRIERFVAPVSRIQDGTISRAVGAGLDIPRLHALAYRADFVSSDDVGIEVHDLDSHPNSSTCTDRYDLSECTDPDYLVSSAILELASYEPGDLEAGDLARLRLQLSEAIAGALEPTFREKDAVERIASFVRWRQSGSIVPDDGLSGRSDQAVEHFLVAAAMERFEAAVVALDHAPAETPTLG